MIAWWLIYLTPQLTLCSLLIIKTYLCIGYLDSLQSSYWNKQTPFFFNFPKSVVPFPSEAQRANSCFRENHLLFLKAHFTIRHSVHFINWVVACFPALEYEPHKGKAFVCFVLCCILSLELRLTCVLELFCWVNLPHLWKLHLIHWFCHAFPRLFSRAGVVW